MENMFNLKKDDVITIIGIGGFMGNTTKTVIKFTGDYTLSGKPIFKENKKGSRKKFTLKDFNGDTLVFKDEVPFQIDGEMAGKPTTGGFTSTIIRGNACINLFGNADTIKEWVEKFNLNDKFTSKANIVLVGDDGSEKPLYPEIYTDHAVIQRMKADLVNKTN